MLYLGIDGGGTKTDLCLFDISKGVIAQLHRPSLDYHAIGLLGYRKRLEQDMQEICRLANCDAADIAAVTVGTPCYGEDPEASKQLEELAQSALCAAGKVVVVNDVFCAMMGGLGGETGICILAGTGSMAMGIDPDGQVKRAGGWSRYYSDTGSAHWLGVQGMHLFTLQADGLVEKGPLYELVMHRYQLTSPLSFIAIGDETFESREQTAAFQRLLLEAATAGDASACALYEQAAEALGRLALCVKKELNFVPGKMVRAVYAGGLFRCGSLIQAPLTALLGQHGISLAPPQYAPVIGAVLYAAHQLGEEQEAATRQHFMGKVGCNP